MIITQKETVRLREAGFDLELVEKIQIKGGAKFSFDRHMLTGNGYVSCLVVQEFAEDVSFKWLSDIMGIPETVSTLDLVTANKEEVVKNINKSISELSYQTVKERRTTDKADAYHEKLNLEDFAEMITQKGEIVKNLIARIYIYDDSLEELEKKVSQIRKDLGSLNHKAVVHLFRSKDDYQSLFKDGVSQMNSSLARQGEPIPSTNIGGGIPFHHKALKDPQGFYLGQTSTGGAFVFDPFRSTSERRSFNGFILGKMGFGKSTLLKQLQEGLKAKNAFIRGFDKSGEYERLVREEGGVYIDLSGGDKKINPLDIMATVLNKDNSIDEQKSFLNHLTKCSNQIRNLEPDIDNSTITEFEDLLREFYTAKGFIPKGFLKEAQPKVLNICRLPKEKYPTYTDFRNYLNEIKFTSATPERIRSLEIIQVTVNSMCENYAQIFDGITTMPDFENEKIVFYDTSKLSKLKEPIFQCQLFTALTIIWDNALKNGSNQKQLLKDKAITQKDLEYFMVLLDECHNYINPNNVYACEYIATFQREMRKFRAGVYFATQSPQEIIPTKADSRVTKIIRTIFELCTVKVLFNLDASILKEMKGILGETVTESEVMILPELPVGQAIVQTSSRDSYLVKFDPEEDQLERFEGGQ